MYRTTWPPRMWLGFFRSRCASQANLSKLWYKPLNWAFYNSKTSILNGSASPFGRSLSYIPRKASPSTSSPSSTLGPLNIPSPLSKPSLLSISRPSSALRPPNTSRPLSTLRSINYVKTVKHPETTIRWKSARWFLWGTSHLENSQSVPPWVWCWCSFLRARPRTVQGLELQYEPIQHKPAQPRYPSLRSKRYRDLW